MRSIHQDYAPAARDALACALHTPGLHPRPAGCAGMRQDRICALFLFFEKTTPFLIFSKMRSQEIKMLFCRKMRFLNAVLIRIYYHFSRHRSDNFWRREFEATLRAQNIRVETIIMD